jgi:hypothetical protein
MEAGAYAKELVVESPDASMTKFKIPKDASGKEIHLILEVRDCIALRLSKNYYNRRINEILKILFLNAFTYYNSKSKVSL